MDTPVAILALYAILYFPGQLLLLRGCHVISQLDNGSRHQAADLFFCLNTFAWGFILWPVYLVAVWAIILFRKLCRAVKSLLFTEDQIDDILMKKDNLIHRINEWAAR